MRYWPHARSLRGDRAPEPLYVERTAIAFMADDALDVVRRSADLHRDPEDSAGRDVSEFRIRINEASDQPGAGNAVDLGMLARGCDQACVRVI